MDWVNVIAKINNKFKFQLFGRVVDNLDKMYDNAGVYDSNGTGLMSPHAFNLFLNSFGVYLSTQQLRSIKDYYGQNQAIRYMDFIENVRKDISTKRLATIDHAFAELSVDGAVSLETLLAKFKADMHPHVRSMMKNAEKTQADFEGAIKRRSADGKNLNELQFKEYFYDVNACVPLERQEFFVDILIIAFGLMENRVTIDRLRQMEVTIYEKVRQKTYFKKDEGQKSQSSFRFFDMEDKGLVDYHRFVQTLEKLNCKFIDKEMKVLFQKHCSKPGIMTYEDFCGLLFEMGSGLKDNTNPIYEMAKQEGGYSTTPGMTKKLH